MSLSFSVWSLIFLALIAANLPFVHQRILLFIPIQKKSFWIRLAELVVYYFLLGVLAYLFESGIGGVFKQGWEFYAITACLLIVFAFPGFIFHYLFHRR